MEEEEKKEKKEEKKKDDGVARFFTRFGGNLFVDLWEAQPCLGDQESDSS